MSCNSKRSPQQEAVVPGMYIPKAPATTTPDQAIAISPPGGRCAAVPRGGRGSVVDDISGTGSPVCAVGGRIVDDGGCTRG